MSMIRRRRRNDLLFAAQAGLGGNSPFYSAALTTVTLVETEARSLHLTEFTPLSGEATVQTPVPSTATYSGFIAHVKTNTGSGDIKFTLRVNGGDTNIVIDIPTGETGNFFPTTSTSIVLGAEQLINWKVEETASATLTDVTINFIVSVAGVDVAGITSLNAQQENNQLFAALDGITINSSGGVHTFGIANKSIRPVKLSSQIADAGEILIANGSGGFDVSPATLGILSASPQHTSGGTDSLFFSFSSGAPAAGSGFNDDRRTVVPFDCVVRGLIVFIENNNKNDDTEYTLMLNEVATSLVVIVPNGSADDFFIEDVPSGIAATKGKVLSLRQEQPNPDGQNITLQSFAVVLNSS